MKLKSTWVLQDTIPNNPPIIIIVIFIIIII